METVDFVNRFSTFMLCSADIMARRGDDRDDVEIIVRDGEFVLVWIR